MSAKFVILAVKKDPQLIKLLKNGIDICFKALFVQTYETKY